MSQFLTEVSFKSAAGGEEVRLPTTKDMERWLDSQEPFWKSVDITKVNDGVRGQWRQQLHFFSNARAQMKEFEDRMESGQEAEARRSNQSIQSEFGRVSSGTIVTSDHEFYPAIVDLASTQPELAGILLSTARSDAKESMGTLGNFSLPMRAVFELVLRFARTKGTRDWLQPQRKELQALRQECQGELDQLRTNHSRQNEEIARQNEDAATDNRSRSEEWEKRKLELSKEWDDLKKIYDEKLALLAPTQYWADRATDHRKVAIRFAIAFAVVLAGSIGIFAWLAMPHLFAVATAKEVSPVLTLIPVGIPAFAGIWVLKMLSRMLSENLQMMRDARERETMVKTFLALMRDDKSGKSIVNDNDRILILHSLFRPSSVSAVDDAPPVHWFDILTNKVSGRER